MERGFGWALAGAWRYARTRKWKLSRPMVRSSVFMMRSALSWALDVEGFAFASEADGAGTVPRAEMTGGFAEAGGWLQAEAAGVADGAEYQVAGELDRGFERLAVVGGKEAAGQAGQGGAVHEPQPQGVLDPEAVTATRGRACGLIICGRRRSRDRGREAAIWRRAGPQPAARGRAPHHPVHPGLPEPGHPLVRHRRAPPADADDHRPAPPGTGPRPNPPPRT